MSQADTEVYRLCYASLRPRPLVVTTGLHVTFGPIFDKKNTCGYPYSGSESEVSIPNARLLSTQDSTIFLASATFQDATSFAPKAEFLLALYVNYDFHTQCTKFKAVCLLAKLWRHNRVDSMVSLAIATL